MTEILCKNEKCIWNQLETCFRSTAVLGDANYSLAAILECLSAEYRKEKANEEAKQTYFKAKVTD